MNKSLLVIRIDFFYLYHNVSHTLIPKRNPEPGVIFSATRPRLRPGFLLDKSRPSYAEERSARHGRENQSRRCLFFVGEDPSPPPTALARRASARTASVDDGRTGRWTVGNIDELWWCWCWGGW